MTQNPTILIRLPSATLLRSRPLLAGLTALALLVVGIFIFRLNQLRSAAERAVRSQETQLESGSRIPFERHPIPVAGAPTGTALRSRATILDVLPAGEVVLVSTTQGIDLVDLSGSLVQRLDFEKGWPAGDVLRMTDHGGVPALAVERFGVLFLGPDATAIIPVDPALRDVTDVLSTPQGDLWVATRNGLLRWKDELLMRAFPRELEKTHVTVLGGNSVDLWVGSHDEGLFHFSAGRWARFGNQEGLPDNQVTALQTTGGNTVYVGTPLGLAALRGGRVVQTTLPGEFILSVLVTDQRVFVGTLSGHCFSMDLDLRRPAPVTPFQHIETEEIAPLHVFELGAEIMATKGDRMWKAAASRQIVWRDFATLDYGVSPTLTHRNISSLSVDTEGRLWVGYFDHGLDILDALDSLVTHLHDDVLFCINAIHSDSGSRVTYVATANGLVTFTSPNDYRVLRKEDGLIDNHITAAVPQQSGSPTVYLATAAGLGILGSEGVRALNAFHGLPSNRLYGLAPAPDGVYAGTLSGLSFVPLAGPPRNFGTANSPLRHNWVNAVVRVGRDVWLGTYGGGIQVLDTTGGWTDFPPPISDLHVNPGALFHYGNDVYAGTLEAGFLVFDVDSRRWAQVQRPLPSLNVTAFAGDDTSVYVGTDRGLVRFSREEIRQIPRSGIPQ